VYWRTLSIYYSFVFWIPVTAPEFIVLIPPMASTFVYNSVENFWSFVSTLSNFRPYKHRYVPYIPCDADKVNGAIAVARRFHTHQKDCPEGQKTVATTVRYNMVSGCPQIYLWIWHIMSECLIEITIISLYFRPRRFLCFSFKTCKQRENCIEYRPTHNSRPSFPSLSHLKFQTHFLQRTVNPTSKEKRSYLNSFCEKRVSPPVTRTTSVRNIGAEFLRGKKKYIFSRNFSLYLQE